MYLNTFNQQECYGCRACEDICPNKCISMVEDIDGFVYPVVDDDKCVDCGLCKKTCPNNYEAFHTKNDENAVVGVHLSDDVRFNSSSGGAFTAIYETIIDEGFEICGVRWNEELQVIHDFADTREKCEAFRKSKYVLSNTNHCYSRIENKLKNGKCILFTGSPCECAALQSYLDTKRISKENLIIVDIVCHGAPSQKVFDKYVNELNDEAEVYTFRFKNKIPYCGVVNSRTAEIIYKNGCKKVVDKNIDVFLKGYYGRLFYRPSCETCEFARIERVSDMTIADAWGVENIVPEFDSLSGTSLILANSEKGKRLLEKIKGKMKIKEVSVNWAEQANAQLRVSTTMHRGRKQFFDLLDDNPFSYAVNKSMKKPLYRKVGSKIKSIIKSMLPSKTGGG